MKYLTYDEISNKSSEAKQTLEYVKKEKKYYRLSSEFWIESNAELIQELKECFGEDNIRTISNK